MHDANPSKRIALFVLHFAKGILFLSLALILAPAPSEAAAPAKERERLVIGATLDFSGNSIVSGQSILNAVSAALDEFNARSNGPLLELRAVDDAGDPARAAENLRTLGKDARLVALIGCLGEAHCLTVAQGAQTLGIPFVGALTGNPALCGPGGLAFCVRASYTDEAVALARMLKSTGISAAVVMTSHAYRDSAAAIRDALDRSGLAASTVLLARKTPGFAALKEQVRKLAVPESTGFILHASSEEAAELLREIRLRWPSASISALSSIQPYQWLQMTGAAARGVLIAHAVQDPDRPPLPPLVRQYHQAVERFSDAYSHEQFEAYLSGQLLGEAIRQTRPPSRAGLFLTLGKLGQVSLAGEPVSFGSRSGSSLPRPVYLSIVGPDGRLIE